MRIIHTETIAYKFSELAKAEQQKAIEGLWDINVESNWWEYTYEDAKNIGLKITGFDLDRGQYCEGKFILSVKTCADRIIAEYGEGCEIHKTAQAFLKEYQANIDKRDSETGDSTTSDESEDELNDELDEIEAEFLKNLLEDYRIILQHEFEYQTSREAIIETIDATGYEFTRAGKLI